MKEFFYLQMQKEDLSQMPTLIDCYIKAEYVMQLAQHCKYVYYSQSGDIKKASEIFEEFMNEENELNEKFMEIKEKFVISSDDYEYLGYFDENKIGQNAKISKLVFEIADSRQLFGEKRQEYYLAYVDNKEYVFIKNELEFA